MSIFGTKKRQMRGCGCRGVGLGASDVPWWCWNVDGFKACSDQQFKIAQQEAIADGEKPGTEAYDYKVLNKHNGYVESICVPACLEKQPSAPVSTTVPAGACNSKPVITAVQKLIGTPSDGIWGPKSAAALKASGKTFQQLAPGCTGAVPGGGGGGGGGVTTPIKSSYVPPGGGGVAQASAGFMGIPLIVWGGVAAVAVVLLIAKKKKPMGAVPNRRRRHRRNGCHR